MYFYNVIDTADDDIEAVKDHMQNKNDDRLAMIERKMQQLRGEMDYDDPTHPDNSHFSEWLKDLWRGDYEAVMGHIDQIEGDKEKVFNLLEERESLLNVSAVFHVIIGARAVCGENPRYSSAQRIMKNEHEMILAKLIELGANIHARDVTGYTPLHYCLSSSSNTSTLALARQLLKAGADANSINKFGCTALFEPVMSANLDAVKLLLEFGADPNIKNEAGFSCRFTAMYQNEISSLFSQADKKKVKEMRTAIVGRASLCQVCRVDSDIKRCTGCYMVWYCGQVCQNKDWSDHKVECKVTRKQYKKVKLVENNMVNRENATNKMYVTKVGDGPKKKHFVVKVQVPLTRLDGTGPMLLYNQDKSVYGHMYRVEQVEVYDMLDKNIRTEGFNGQKGFYYAIFVGQGRETKKNNNTFVNIKINPVTMLPVEEW